MARVRPYETIRFAKRGAVAIVMLDRPESLNAYNVAMRDDLFASALPAASFDLVHLRFQLAPLGRVEEQLASARRLAKPGGWLVLEDPDTGGWLVINTDELTLRYRDRSSRSEKLRR